MKYEINTINDLLKLTPEQLPRCFADLQDWYNFAKPLSEITDLKSSTFTWVDDGVVGARKITLDIKEKK